MSPPEVVLTSIDTTLGTTREATPAIDFGARSTSPPSEVGEPIVIEAGRLSEAVCRPTTPPIMPPTNAATATMIATAVHDPGPACRGRGSGEGTGGGTAQGLGGADGEAQADSPCCGDGGGQGPGSVIATIVVHVPGASDGRHYPVTVNERSEAEIALDNRAFTESWLVEDQPTLDARPRGEDLGAVPIGAGGGAVLRFLAACIGARAVIEVGTGAGVSGTWLLRGMAPDGVLTSIDRQPEHQQVAKQTFVRAGFAANRFRLISGPALEVLPRLTDGAYDLVFLDAAKSEYSDYLTEALRLLRPGGILAVDNALWHGQVADPASRDPDAVAIRDLLRRVRDDDRLTPLLLPSGDGLLAALVGEAVPVSPPE